MNSEVQALLDHEPGVQRTREEMESHLLKYRSIPLRILIREDAIRYRSPLGALLFPGFWVTFWYRISFALYERGFDVLAQLIQRLNQLWSTCELSRKALIGPGFAMFHHNGVYIGPGVLVGKQVTLNSSAFLSSINRDGEYDKDCPYIGDGVVVSAGAKIFGPIVVGDAVQVGPNAVVMKTVPPFSNVLPPNALVMSRNAWKQGAGAAAVPAKAVEPDANLAKTTLEAKGKEES